MNSARKLQEQVAATTDESRDKKGRFRKGFSGNPGGRPKNVSITAKLRRLLSIPTDPGNPDSPQVLDAVVEKVLELVLDGNPAIVKELWNRIDGKVPDRVEPDLPPTWRTEFVVVDRASVEDEPLNMDERRVESLPAVSDGDT